MPTRSARKKISNSSDICIAGGGVVGLSSALALARDGFSVTLVEASAAKKTQTDDIRAFALAHSGLALYDRLGVVELDQFLSPIRDMRVVEAHPLRGVCSAHLHLSTSDMRPQQGRRNLIGAIIEANDLLKLLRARVAETPAIELLQGLSASEFQADEGGVEVVLKKSAAESATERATARVRARLLIACDGRESTLRARAEIPCTRLRYGQNALVCVLAHERAHRGVAVEWFMPSGTFASLPMRGGRSGIVWCDKPHVIDRAVAMDERDFMRHVRVRFGDWLGGLRLVSKRFAYPLSLCHAQRYSQRRFLLLGDAAHAIHPLAGQGLNLGLRDIALLSKTMRTALLLGADIASPALLKRYERERRADNNALVFATHGLQHLFCNDYPTLRAARTGGLALISRMAFVKRQLLHSATGSAQ